MPPFTPPSPPLADQAVLLAPMGENDVRDFLKGTAQPDVARFAYARTFDDESAREYLRDLAGPRRERGESILFAIREPGSDDFLGALQFFRVDWDRAAAEVGFWLLPAARGRGLARRALALALDWVTGQGIERVEAHTDVENVTAQKAMEAAGFEREGVLRGFKPGAHGRVDYLAYGRLAP